MDDKQAGQIIQALNEIKTELQSTHKLMQEIYRTFAPLLIHVASIDAKTQSDDIGANTSVASE